MLRAIFFIGFYLFSGSLFSQVDTALVVEDVIIYEAAGRSNSIGSRLESFSLEGQSFSEGIARNTNIYLKNYGLGSLSIPSMRGGSASHTLVTWNGLPLLNPMLGLLDFSLISNGSVDNIDVQRGGNSSAWGSGAISGTINLKNVERKQTRISLRSTVGSFGLLREAGQINLHKGKITSNTKFSIDLGDRDFTYKLTQNKPEIKQENSYFSRYHLVQDLFYQYNSKLKLASHFWISKAYTEIPATTVQSNSEAYQQDDALRGVLKLFYILDKGILNTTIGYFNDLNHYKDSATLIDSENRYSSLFIESSIQLVNKNSNRLKLGIIYSRTKAESPGYQVTSTENKVGLFASTTYKYRSLTIQPAIRQDIIDSKFNPITPSFGIELQLGDRLKFLGKISRDFRNPTLNDRNWHPGGNADLMPESGWSEEVGYELNSHLGLLTFQLKTTAFHRSISNWIMWTPTEGMPFWSAKNINKVISKGIEQEIVLGYSTKDFNVENVLSYDYIKSTFQENLTLPKVVKGDQLLYTPLHKFHGRIKVASEVAFIQYIFNITGPVSGVNENVPGYNLHSVELGGKILNKPANLEGKLSVNNLSNTNYRIIERRPMPGRNYELTISIKF